MMTLQFTIEELNKLDNVLRREKENMSGYLQEMKALKELHDNIMEIGKVIDSGFDVKKSDVTHKMNKMILDVEKNVNFIQTVIDRIDAAFFIEECMNDTK